MNKTELFNEIQSVLHDIKDNKPIMEEFAETVEDRIFTNNIFLCAST